MLFSGLGVPEVSACVGLAGAQGLTVALPSGAVRTRLARRGPWIAAVPPLGFGALVLLLARSPDVAGGISVAATIAVPLLAAAALGLLARRRRGAWLAAAPALLTAAILWHGRTVGQLAALAIAVLSAAACGTIVAARARPGLVAVGLVAMAALDVVLLAGGRVQMATHALEQVHTGSLPGFAEERLGGWHIGYADLLVAGIAGGVAARSRRRQGALAALTLVLAVGEAALLATRHGSYPATPPVAVALAIALIRERRAVRHP